MGRRPGGAHHFLCKLNTEHCQLFMKHLLTLLLLASVVSAAEVRTVLTPAELSASGTTPVLRTEDWKGQGTIVFASTAATSGTNPTLAVKLQSSPAERRFHSVTATNTNGFLLRTAAATNTAIAAKQTFTGARQISSVVLPLRRVGDLADGKIVLSIQGHASTVPNGTNVASVTNAATSVSTNFAGVTFTFSPPVDVATNALTVWFVLTGDYTANASNNIAWRSSTVASNGIAATSTTNAATWTAVTTNDLGLAIDGFNFTDLATYTTVTNAASVQSSEVNLGSHGLLRATYTLGGTGTPKFGASMILVK
jgi:hypothetical protein